MTVHRRVHRKANRNLLDSLFMSRSRLQQGLYCIGCEEYKDEKELMTEDGEEDGIKCLCPIHRTKCESRKERNYFFRLSKYQKEIEQLLEGSIEEGGGAGHRGCRYDEPEARGERQRRAAKRDEAHHRLIIG